MKNLFFLRHAIAVLRGTEGYDDDDRPLTKEGVIKMKKAAKGIARVADPFDAILTSPLKRARETAMIVAQEMKCENKVEDTDLLLPGASIGPIINSLAKHNGKKNVLLVCHEPDLSNMVAALTSVSTEAIEFKKGALCNIEMNSPSAKAKGKLLWLLQPKILRSLA
jgi:phosphohistidine phosphatase